MSDSSSQGAATKAVTKKPRQGRSPAFPFIPISKALDRAEVFRVAEGGRPKHFSPVNSAFAAWKLGPKTGPALQTIAAMGHYGLFEFQGSADTRSARLTDLAFNILLDKQPTSSERDSLIALAALTPAIHAELWLKWGDSLPSDPTLETYLIRDRGFSETGARDLIAEYKATMEFAKLGQSGIIPVVDDDIGSPLVTPNRSTTIQAAPPPPTPPAITAPASANDFNIGLQTDRVVVSASLMDRKMASQLITRLQAIVPFLPEELAKPESPSSESD